MFQILSIFFFFIKIFFKLNYMELYLAILAFFRTNFSIFFLTFQITNLISTPWNRLSCWKTLTVHHFFPFKIDQNIIFSTSRFWVLPCYVILANFVICAMMAIRTTPYFKAFLHPCHIRVSWKENWLIFRNAMTIYDNVL